MKRDSEPEYNIGRMGCQSLKTSLKSEFNPAAEIKKISIFGIFSLQKIPQLVHTHKAEQIKP
ncbi:MAG: hypothetical protein C0403_18955 [Desulfobacterium sp.]|nr:hypothetical protein [Desulfobacterium sp.]